LQAGDRITAVDGQPIDKGADLPAIFTQAETADEFTVEVQRGAATHLLTVRLPTEGNAT
jgi:S1-C subfamily serine protease